MNAQQFMGLDYLYWTFICLAVAVFYFILWPKPSAYTSRSRWQHVVLRYFHALVWVFLSGASLLRALYSTQPLLLLSDLLLISALLTYLVFLFTFLRERREITKRKI
jgi:hypothetical protein